MPLSTVMPNSESTPEKLPDHPRHHPQAVRRSQTLVEGRDEQREVR
jgi:hypothetical protein